MPALAVLVAVTVVHLVAQAVDPGGVLADLTQVLLVPALAWLLVTSTPSPTSQIVRLALLALGFSWLGDTLPRFFDDGSDAAFWWLVGCFTLAQIAYIAAFLPFVRRSIIVTRPVLLIPYVLAMLVLLLVTKGEGSVVSPVMIYVVAILLMAVLATGLDRVAATGAVVFLVSDALIALAAFTDLELPLHAVLVMLTYVIAQGLLVTSIAHADRAERVGHSARAVAQRV